MVRHLRRELRHQRFAEFNLLLTLNGKADAKFVHRPQRDDALGQIGRLLDDPRRERIRVARACSALSINRGSVIKSAPA
jgi:hypothetical protein